MKSLLLIYHNGESVASLPVNNGRRGPSILARMDLAYITMTGMARTSDDELLEARLADVVSEL